MPVRLTPTLDFLKLAVLRPAPGNAATVARAAAAGFETVSLALFAVEPLAWEPSDPAQFDALILTSANAVRCGGAGLAGLRGLPVLAVGARTAAAARAAGFAVTETGADDATALVATATAHGVSRALHLGGRERTLTAGGPIAAVRAVYANVAQAIDPADLLRLRGTTALLHSARAAQRLGALVDDAGLDRRDVAVAAFSPAVATAAGTGWADIAVAARPDDAALFAAIVDAGPPSAR